MSTFKNGKREFAQYAHKIQEIYDLDIALVKNIIMYARALLTEGTSEIGQNVFSGEMNQIFNLTDGLMVSRIYHVCRNSKDPKAKVNADDFARLVCLFLTEKIDLQINFVFKVYDTNHDGFIDTTNEFPTLLRPTVTLMNKYTDINEEEEDGLRDVIDMAMQTLGLKPNSNKSFNLEEFRALVKENPLRLQCLGQCLPIECDIEYFKNKIKDMAPYDVAEIFFKTRDKTIIAPKIPKKKLFPITMEMV